MESEHLTDETLDLIKCIENWITESVNAPGLTQAKAMARAALAAALMGIDEKLAASRKTVRRMQQTHDHMRDEINTLEIDKAALMTKVEVLSQFDAAEDHT